MHFILPILDKKFQCMPNCFADGTVTLKQSECMSVLQLPAPESTGHGYLLSPLASMWHLLTAGVITLSASSNVVAAVISTVDNWHMRAHNDALYPAANALQHLQSQEPHTVHSG